MWSISQSNSVQPAELTRDEDFLRRVNLDLGGVIPSPQEVIQFVSNPDVLKRSEKIDELLKGSGFAETWARYWGDVIFLRATEPRSRVAEPAFEKWMQDQLAQNRPWSEITRGLLTATGNVQEDGQTGLIFAHSAQPEELAGEISRIFLGIQFSCANCHDHPTDQWKREQFHQLAAFLPRITVRPESPGEVRTFAVISLDDLGRGAGRDQEIDLDQLFRRLDRNRDGLLSRQEARGPLANRFDRIVANFDRDQNGLLSKEELTEARLQANNQPGRGSREYYMPDLDNPTERGTLIQPAFFINDVPGPKLIRGAGDLARRNALADYVTSPTNPWFARAFVNRVWGELLGEGFYMPIDDLGPERVAVDEDVLELLCRDFIASGYDIKRLYRTIVNTEAYQRQIQPPQNERTAPFAAARPTRLRSDRIFNSLMQVLGLPRAMDAAPRPGGETMMQAPGIDPRKVGFATLFGYDPSTPQEDLLGNVPQALFMMNSRQLDRATRGSGIGRLARLLRENSKDEDALGELYLLVLSRTPTPHETAINLAYIREVDQRTEAFEDIIWSLLNSTEFISRR